MSTQEQTKATRRPARRPARKPVTAAGQSANPTPTDPSATAPPPPTQAPAYNEGIKPQDAAQLIEQATPEQIKALMQTDFALWAQMSGIEVDNRKFEFDNHRYLLPIYLDNNREVIWMKSAQMGATIYQLLRLLWYARHHQVKAGLYFPTADGVTKLSKDRLTPLIKSNLDLLTHVSDAANTLGLKQINNIYSKMSSLYMLYMGGTASKDSVPLDIISFDEVRLISQTDIDQAIERISHSTYKIKIYMSTAGMPDCFDGSTKIVVRHKETGFIYQKPIAELVDTYRNFQALSYNRRGGNRTRWRDITGAVCRGVRPMVRVKLWNGHEIRCTSSHRFAQLGDANKGSTILWTPIEDVERHPVRHGGVRGPENGVLCVNDIPERFNGRWDLNSPMGPYDLLTYRVLGAYIAEGTMTDSGEISIWQTKDTNIVSYCSEWATNNGLTCRKTVDGVFIQANRRPDLRSLFAQCGKGEPNKRIPEHVLSGSKEQLLELFEGMIEGDGHRRKPRTRTRDSHREFDYYTTSKELAHQVWFLGLRLGMPLALSTREPRKDNHSLCYCLSYNPKSFRQNEVFPELGQLAVSSVHDDGEDYAYDLEIEENPWFVLAESGCLVHNSDIHRRFLKGKQYYWHCKCNCSDGFIPSDVFPDCIVDTGKEVYLRCPKCKMRIIDPQNGRYIAHNETAEASSYHISQFISRFISPKEIWDAYQTTTNMKEFHNAKLGKPYIDEENMPITEDVLEQCVDTNLQWAESLAGTKDLKRHCAMGVDQHSGNCCVLIAKRGRDGIKQLVHAEVIDSSNPQYWEDDRPVSPFKRVHELMKEFDVRMCVIDAMPNANEAQELARAFPARVFIAWYQDGGQDMVRWNDRLKTKEAIRKGSKKLRLKWQVVLHRYLSLDFALKQFVDGAFRMPDPRQLTQVCRSLETGRHEVEAIVKTRVWENLKSMVRQKTILDEETGRFKMEWIYVNRDPHFSHAINYMNVALERLRRQAMFTLV